MSGKNLRSTYEEIASFVRAEMNRDDELADVGDGLWRTWILQAEEEICTLMNVEEEFRFRIRSSYDRINFGENPRISAVSAASPAVCTTASAHGLTTGDIIKIARAVGTEVINLDKIYVTVSSTTQFSIKKYGRVTGATYATPIVIEEKAHGRATGDSVTISGVLGNTAANATWTITLVDQDNYSLDTSVGNATYTSGGEVVSDISTVGLTYTGGARWWKENEVWSLFKNVRKLRCEIGNFIQEIDVEDFRTVVNLEIFDNVWITGLAATYIYPVKALMHSKEGVRYIRIYPQPTETFDVTAFGWLHVPPGMYADDPFTSLIHLRPEYESLIRLYVQAMAYGHLRDIKTKLGYMQMFKQEAELRNSKVPPKIKMQVTYQ